MAKVKEHLTSADIGRLLNLDAAAVEVLLDAEPLLDAERVGCRTVVSVVAYRRWVRDVGERALRSLRGAR